MNKNLLKILFNPIKAAKEVKDKANLRTKRQEAIIRKLLKKDKK